jgi:hypothetical protein
MLAYAVKKGIVLRMLTRSIEAQPPGAIVTALRHLLCILALMWVGIANGQPLFFSTDSTNYIRAADVAAYLASGKTFSTVWTDKYRAQLDSSSQPPDSSSQVAGETERVRVHSVNDLKNGLIMGGRSPYIGGLMYLGYITGDFWPFVLLQAATAYGLIILSLRKFGLDSPPNLTLVTLGLAATTALPAYNSMLLADAFTGFGILAFLLLATNGGRYSRLELTFLYLVLATFAVAHLTHIMILVGMLAVLTLMAWWRDAGTVPKRAWVAGIGGVLIGFASIQATAFVTSAVFGRKPQLLPLLTARFIADGPGWRYIRSGCDGNRYQMCRMSIGEPRSDALILFGVTKETGAYMLADAEQRRRMGEEDLAFAMSVLRFEPLGQASAIVRNTLKQFFWIEYDGLNQNCFDSPNCWISIPATIRDQLQATPSGRGQWPEEEMTTLLQVTVIFSIMSLFLLRKPLSAKSPGEWDRLRTWLILTVAAMIVNSIFGGAVADPQYRYQTRVSWLLPFFSGLAFLLYSKFRRAGTDRHIHAAAAVESS